MLIACLVLKNLYQADGTSKKYWQPERKFFKSYKNYLKFRKSLKILFFFWFKISKKIDKKLPVEADKNKEAFFEKGIVHYWNNLH